MRIVLFCVLALGLLGAAQSVFAQAVQAPAPATTAPAAAQTNLADKKESASAGSAVATVLGGIGLLALGAGALMFALGFTQQLRRGIPVGIESHWGGLGGGLGGWRISSSLCFFILSLVFAIAFSAVAIKYLDRDAPRQTSASNAPAAGIAK